VHHVRLNILTSDAVEALAEKESRKVGQMTNILVLEALKARGIKPAAPKPKKGDAKCISR
jgi:hypothetical protein